MFKLSPEIELTLCIFREDVLSARHYWHQKNPGPYPRLTPVRHREIVFGGFKREEMTPLLIERYLNLVYTKSVTGGLHDVACSQAAFEIYVELRLWAVLEPTDEPFSRQKLPDDPAEIRPRPDHPGPEEEGDVDPWDVISKSDPSGTPPKPEKEAATPIQYKIKRRPTKRKKHGTEQQQTQPNGAA
jgi:hypothetical protein